MEDFTNKFNMQVSNEAVEVGNTYPLFGMITDFIEEEPGAVLVEINFSIRATLNISDPAKIETLKERAFEPGIFVSKVTSKTEDLTTVDCQTVVFGRKQNYSA